MASTFARIGARALRTRSLVRAPIWLYRHRLGRLMGQRVLMLEHRGRTSGRPRYVCLEVVERSSPTTITVASGFGTRAQWYRNLVAEPRCRVSVGGWSSVPAVARMLGPEESQAALRRYQAAHPAAWRHLQGILEHAAGGDMETLPMVELTLSNPGP